jgi:GNAT superfamily N-acetyltransferase
MDLEVRRARLEDIGPLVALQREVQELHLVNRPADFKPLNDEEVTGWLRGVLQSEEAAIWVAVATGKIVGNAVAMRKHRAEHTYSPARTWCEVDQIVVTRAQRRKGIARALLQAVVDDARAKGIAEIELTSWSFNTDAHRAFEAFGFAPKLVRFELRSR